MLTRSRKHFKPFGPNVVGYDAEQMSLFCMRFGHFMRVMTYGMTNVEMVWCGWSAGYDQTTTPKRNKLAVQRVVVVGRVGRRFVVCSVTIYSCLFLILFASALLPSVPFFSFFLFRPGNL